MSELLTVCRVIGIIIVIFIAYKAIFAFFGVFNKKVFKETENKHKYAILVHASNSEKDINNFLQTVCNQDYPKDKLSIFVVANNSTDNTVGLVNEFAQENQEQIIKVYKYENEDKKTKGFALKHLIGMIDKEYNINTFEGYFVFDADNLLSKDYVSKMNNAFDAGYGVVNSFKNSKNLFKNWLSFSFGMHWMRTALYENRGKAFLKQSCRLQESGYLFATRFIRNGWQYTSLTEDRQFCNDVVIKNESVTYCDDAVFYAEQPQRFKEAFRKFIVWGKGHTHAALKQCPILFKNLFKSSSDFTSTFDMFWTNFPFAIEGIIRKMVIILCVLIIGISSGAFLLALKSLFIGVLVSIAVAVLLAVIQLIPIYVIYKKRFIKFPLLKVVIYTAMFPIFDILVCVASFISMFKKLNKRADEDEDDDLFENLKSNF